MSGAKPNLKKLSEITYEWDGKKMHFWALAPTFKTQWAIERVDGYTRHFVWLVDADRKFYHAVVATGVSKVLKVNVTQERDMFNRIKTRRSLTPGERWWNKSAHDTVTTKLLTLAGFNDDGSLKRS